MRYVLLNLLACPMCKSFPLRLLVFEEGVIDKKFSVKTPFCDLYCGLRGSYLKDLKVEELNCSECVKHDVLWGILHCSHCGRWYPVIDGIPFMYPDDLRAKPRIKSKEEQFISKYADRIPAEITEKDPLKILRPKTET
ncbi:MAG: Trm112 family protein [Sulfolobales archaeon]